MKKYFKLYDNPVLVLIVNWIIKKKMFDTKGKYKIGDRVRYNIFAKIVIWSVIKDKMYTRTIESIWSNGVNVDFTDGGGCDSFWIRKIYFWER